MVDWKRLRIGSVIVVLAIYWFLSGAIRYNLAATASLLAANPATVVIDAGHGGEDGGALSASGVRESEINLSVALRLEQILALCGVRTAMIRTEDVSVSVVGDTISERKISDLKQRVKLANAYHHGILVSIHQNQFQETKYTGAQVFYAPTDGSKELAQIAQSLLRQSLDPGNRREIKPADSVYLLQQVQCPAVLVECGFLSNPQEAALLQTDAYQKQLVCVLTGAVTRYLEGEQEVEI